MKESSIKLLINLVKMNPLLYNPKHRDNKNMALKTKTWLKIADEIGCTVVDAKRKWKYLRERYRRIKGEIYLSDDQKIIKQWPLFQSLTFLEKHCQQSSMLPILHPTFISPARNIKIEAMSPPLSPEPKLSPEKPTIASRIEKMEFVSVPALSNPIETGIDFFPINNLKRTHDKVEPEWSGQIGNLLKKVDTLITTTTAASNVQKTPEHTKGKHHHFSNYLEVEMNGLSDNEANEFKNFCLVKLYEIQNKRKN